MSVPGFRELRVLTLRRGLKRALQAVNEVEELDPEVGQRLRVRYQRLTDDAQEQLGESDDDLAQAENLIAETLEFLAGAAARKIDYDRGLSKLALAWLDQLSTAADLPSVGLVIPSTSEFTGMLTQVVRLRVPSEGVWALPVAAHEYGHFVAAQLQDRVIRDGLPDAIHPVEDALEAAARQAELPQLYRHGHELFADALATAIVGSAYTWYCVRYRFPPKTAQKATGTHPAPVRRIRMQLGVLDRLAPADGSGYMAGDVGEIRDVWKAALEAEGGSVDVPVDPVLDQLEAELTRIVFEDSHFKGIRYDDHAAAWALAVNPLGDVTSLAHVLNAAWTRRRQLEKTANISEDKVIEGLDVIDEWARSSATQVLA